jgi:dGTPase
MSRPGGPDLDDDRSCPGYGDPDVRRWVREPAKRSGRTAFARDRARVLHSASFRRLAAKTQIHVAGIADFPRTRLTHTLEVAQIGRELGELLGADPDLVDTAGLAHDLGHPPFGHNGEDALDEFAVDIGGFEGNAQTLRVLTRLEAKTFAGPGDPRAGGSVGLNLTRAALDATCKYPWPRRPGERKFGTYADDLDVFAWFRAGTAGDRRSVEAQVMDFADDVAYSVHDLEDAVHAGHVGLAVLTAAAGPGDPEGVVQAARGYAPDADPEQLEQALARLVSLPYWPASYGGTLREQAALKNLASRLIGRFCSGAHAATRERHGPAALTRYDGDLVVPAPIRLEVAVLKGVANRYVMQREVAQRAHSDQRDLLLELAQALLEGAPQALDGALAGAYDEATDDAARRRVVVDQIACLTDTSVVRWHKRMCR